MNRKRKQKKGCFFFICITALILLIIIATVVGSILVKRYSLTEKPYTAADFGIEELESTIDADNDGIDDYTDILEGARAYIETRPTYKSKYYEGGYPTDKYGVCTDVVAQAMKGAGYDLKLLVDDDIAKNLQNYTTIETPEPNIDFRRVKNLNIFFEKNAEVLSTELDDAELWQGGDIVVYKTHIAICSDKRNKDGIPFILHHDGGGAREANNIDYGKIIGHYRWNKSDY